MSAERAIYLDSSAIVKLVVVEEESLELRRYLRRRRPLVSSALARTEVIRVVRPAGDAALTTGHKVLGRIGLVRVTNSILDEAGLLEPIEVRSLDAIHLATALRLQGDLAAVVTYDDRMSEAAKELGLRVHSPGA